MTDKDNYTDMSDCAGCFACYVVALFPPPKPSLSTSYTRTPATTNLLLPFTVTPLPISPSIVKYEYVRIYVCTEYM